MRPHSLVLWWALCACAPSVASAPVSSESPAAPRSTSAATVNDTSRAPDPPGADPTINDSWRGEDIEPLVGRLEEETREIYVHRAKILEIVGVHEGQRVADIGAGSGFMSLLFAERVGPSGKVIAIDINPKLLERIDTLAVARKLPIETRAATQSAAPLEPESVDLVFICDTYHHLEAPGPTMRSLHAALRPGGELVVVDFERIPGVTSDKMLDHVRAGKEVFRAEIVDAGFEWVGEHELPELDDNYVLRFVKAK